MGTDKDRILIVDDEDYARTVLQRWLETEGYDCTTAVNGREAWDLLKENSFDLVVSDLLMPEMSGLELLGLTRASHPDLATIMVTGVEDRKTAIRALELGAFAYIMKPIDQTEILVHTYGALERRRLHMMHQRHEEHLEEAVRERTRELRQREEEIALRLVWAAESRDQDTGAHIRRIGLYSAALAEKIGWSKHMVDDIRVAATMHDVGKIGISDELLLKPDKLTPGEYESMKKHPEIGATILKDSDIPLIQMAQEIALCHHEKWDGSGYPRGLEGKEIPESARIVSLVDVYDAMTSERVYKSGMSEDEALEKMEKDSGSHFDPEIFDAFREIQPLFVEIRKQVGTHFSE